MATITISLDDKSISKFRSAVKRKKGEGKGKLGEATREALDKWTQEVEQEEISKRLKKSMKDGFKLGGKKFKRSEIYEGR